MDIINVIISNNGIINHIESFIVSTKSSKVASKQIRRAENYFTKTVIDKGISNIKDILDEDYYEINGWEISIIWSHNINK